MCLIDACEAIKALAAESEHERTRPDEPCTLCKPDEPCYWHRDDLDGTASWTMN